eukprot:738225-Rhodomonas_salina.2
MAGQPLRFAVHAPAFRPLVASTEVDEVRHPHGCVASACTPWVLSCFLWFSFSSCRLCIPELVVFPRGVRHVQTAVGDAVAVCGVPARAHATKYHSRILTRVFDETQGGEPARNGIRKSGLMKVSSAQCLVLGLGSAVSWR